MHFLTVRETSNYLKVEEHDEGKLPTTYLLEKIEGTRGGCKNDKFRER
jgi:hypothetical protein